MLKHILFLTGLVLVLVLTYGESGANTTSAECTIQADTCIGWTCQLYTGHYKPWCLEYVICEIEPGVYEGWWETCGCCDVAIDGW